MRLVLLAAGLLGGCASAGGPAAGPYQSLPAAPPPEAVAVAQPAVPTGDEALDAFLADFAAAIDRKAWRSVAEAFDPDAYAARFAAVRAGAESDQAAAVAVVADVLGLGGLLGGATPSLDDLGRIRVVTLRGTEDRPGGAVRVTGDVRLEDGQTLPIAFDVRGRGGTYHVVVPGA